MGTKKPSRSAPRRAAPGAKALVLAAIRKGDGRRVKALLTANPELVNEKDDDGSSLLLYALYRNQSAIADLIRSSGALLSIYDAAAIGDNVIVKELLTEDPRLIGFWSHDGWSVLHLAAYFGHTDVVSFLLDQGADMHAISRNANSVMPLHSALSNNQQESALLLIERGADIEARQPTYEYTPLHYAAANGLTAIIQRLIELGAKTAVEGLDGKTPADLARENGHRGILPLLGQTAD
jgi:ankyrin repeat protein